MVPAAILDQRLAFFRERLVDLGLAVTHQRLIIYEALASSLDHPTPEAIFEHVRTKIPAISLATVYKNIHTFSEAGLLREVNLLHESARLDANLEPHHHLVCTRCQRVADLDAAALEPPGLPRKLPGGFRPQRVQLEVLGLCAACASAQ